MACNWYWIVWICSSSIRSHGSRTTHICRVKRVGKEGARHQTAHLIRSCSLPTSLTIHTYQRRPRVLTVFHFYPLYFHSATLLSAVYGLVHTHHSLFCRCILVLVQHGSRRSSGMFFSSWETWAQMTFVSTRYKHWVLQLSWCLVTSMSPCQSYPIFYQHILTDIDYCHNTCWGCQDI